MASGSPITLYNANGDPITFPTPAVDGSTPTSPGTSETKITAATMPAGGVGWTGWLSAAQYELTRITARLPANLGQALGAASLPVVLPSDQADLPVKPGTAEAKVTAASMPAGGVGYIGWLSSISNYLSQNVFVGDNADAQGTGTGGRLLAVSRATVYNSATGNWDRARGDGNGAYAVPTPTDQSQAAIAPAKSVNDTSSSAIIKTSAGNLYDIMCWSSAACYFILIDANAVPSSGATIIPVWFTKLAADAVVSEVWSVPKRFSTGVIGLFSTTRFTYTPSATGFQSAGVR